MAKFKLYYNFGSIVFITIVTNNGIPILVKNIQLIRKSLKLVKYNFKILAGVVMFDHIHIIIEPENLKDIPKIIGFFKSGFTKMYKVAEGLPSERNIKIWQSSYYNHIIRDENDLNKHLDYIHYNPTKHYNIAPKDWEFSSFSEFVEKGFYEQDWCNFGDKNKIVEIDLE